MISNKNTATPRPRTFDKTNHNDEVKAVGKQPHKTFEATKVPLKN